MWVAQPHPRPRVAAGARVHGLPQATDGGRRGPRDRGAGLSTELVAGRRKGTARDGRPQALPAGRRHPRSWMLAALAACMAMPRPTDQYRYRTPGTENRGFEQDSEK